MRSYETLGCQIQALLEAGYQLTIKIEFQPQASSGSIKVGTMTLRNEGAKGFHQKFEGADDAHSKKVVEILRRYKQ